MSVTTPLPSNEVTVVPWPTNDSLRFDLAAQHLPRLLMIPSDADPPELLDDLEDWVRESAQPSDLVARWRLLSTRWLESGGSVPILDEGGLLRYGKRWVVIPDVQLGVVGLLIGRLNKVVPKADFAAAYSACGGSDHPSSIRTLICRLGARAEDVGLELVTIRGRGVLLATTPSASW